MASMPLRSERATFWLSHGYAVLMIVALVSCRKDTSRLIEPPDTAPLATTECVPSDSPDYYFAPNQIDATRDDQFMRQEWFRAYLRAARVEPLSCGEQKEAYRLLWMPAFRNARIITLEHSDGQWFLEAIDFGGVLFQNRKVDSPPLPRTSRHLSGDEVERIRTELLSENFWVAPQFRDNPEMMDGWAMAIEGRTGTRYRVVTRLNVRDDFLRVACVLFQLARTAIPETLKCSAPVSTP